MYKKNEFAVTLDKTFDPTEFSLARVQNLQIAQAKRYVFADSNYNFIEFSEQTDCKLFGSVTRGAFIHSSYNADSCLLWLLLLGEK